MPNRHLCEDVNRQVEMGFWSSRKRRGYVSEIRACKWCLKSWKYMSLPREHLDPENRTDNQYLGYTDLGELVRERVT